MISSPKLYSLTGGRDFRGFAAGAPLEEGGSLGLVASEVVSDADGVSIVSRFLGEAELRASL